MFEEPNWTMPCITISIRDFLFPKEVTGRKHFNQGNDLIRFTFYIFIISQGKKNLLLIRKKKELIHSSIKY